MAANNGVIKKSIETKMFDAFMFFLNMTLGDVIISPGVVCKDKSKFSLACYTKEQLTEVQVNSINFF